MEICLSDVGKEYQRNHQQYSVLKSINLNLKQGDFISVVGKSGSGKSTLLNIIAGVTKPSAGTVSYGEQKYEEITENQFDQLRNQQIGYVSQDNSLLANLTVWDNVRLPNHLYASNKRKTAEEIEELLKQLQILELKNCYLEQLSGGQIQRVAIARAMMNDPFLILADEPTANLDEESSRIILEIFKELAEQGKAVLMVTHDTEAVNYSFRTYKLSDGKLKDISTM